MQSLIGPVGRGVHTFLGETTRITKLALISLYWFFIAPFRGRKGLRPKALFEQLVFVGNESLGIVALVAAAIGAVLALQSAYQLKQYGAVIYTGGLVSVSMTRELGPLITSIVVAGRVGASITAQLATMKVQEEMDALVTMGIPTIPYLVLPRIVAMAIMMPVLAIMANVIGMVGSYLIGVLTLGLPSGLYIQETLDPLVPKDILTGLFKSFIFAILIGLISVHKGLSVEGGAEGVGRMTTQCVVLCIISVVLADVLCTTIFYYAFP